MGDSYENTQMPEKTEESINPDAIPVDDKGRPLPDPTENFRDYIAPSGLEALKRTYEAVEEDEGVKETMEPPQQTTFFKKHRSGKRGYEYYGTPAGSVPNDSNGTKPSALSELFSAAEAVDPDPLELDEDEQFKAFEPIINAQKASVIETPDQKEIKTKAVAESNDPRDAFIKAGYTTADDEVFKKSEVKRDTNTPRILDYYKDSTNTKVIFESESGEDGSALSSAEKAASDLFNSDIPLTKSQIRAAKKEAKRAKKEKARLLKRQERARKKAEKAQRKAELKAKRSGGAFGNMPVLETPAPSAAKEALKDTGNELAERKAKEAAEMARLEKETAERKAQEAAQKAQLEKQAAEKARLEKEAAERKAQEAAQKAQLEKQAAEKARLEKEAAERKAKETAQEAAEKLRKEQEALLRHKEEIKLAQQKNSEAVQKLEEEKAAAQKAREDAELARKEAEKIKAELEFMKNAAAKALAQKQKAEEAAKKAKAEKERLEAEIKKDDVSLTTEIPAKKPSKHTQEEKFRHEREEAIAKAKAEKDAAVAKAKVEREAAIAKAKAEKEAAIAKAKTVHSSKQKSKDVYSDTSKMPDKINEQIHSSNDIYIGSVPKKTVEAQTDTSLLIDKNNIVSRSSKKGNNTDAE